MSNPIPLPTAQSAQLASLPSPRRKGRTPRNTAIGGTPIQAIGPAKFSPLRSLGEIGRDEMAGHATAVAMRDRGEWTAARQAKARELILRIESLVDSMLSTYADALAKGNVKAESIPLACGILMSKRDGLNIELGNAAVTQANRVLAPSDVLLALQALARGAVAQTAPITAHNVSCVASAQVVEAETIPQSEPGGGGSSSARE